MIFLPSLLKANALPSAIIKFSVFLKLIFQLYSNSFEKFAGD